MMVVDGTSSPFSIVTPISEARGDPDSNSSRRTSPELQCFIPARRAMISHSVPFPLPGPPSTRNARNPERRRHPILPPRVGSATRSRNSDRSTDPDPSVSAARRIALASSSLIFPPVVDSRPSSSSIVNTPFPSRSRVRKASIISPISTAESSSHSSSPSPLSFAERRPARMASHPSRNSPYSTVPERSESTSSIRRERRPSVGRSPIAVSRSRRSSTFRHGGPSSSPSPPPSPVRRR
mmetsp:Transcript_19180/g.55813  ORF Transcript_19180/g.55813 Transcript_19180/m.55813 type:complete len:238 (-) Transcript_19180:207-920(-)